MFKKMSFNLFVVISIFSISDLLAVNISWSDLRTQRSYKTTHDIEFHFNDQKKIKMPKGSSGVLKSLASLPMINIYRAEFEFSSCPSFSNESEMTMLRVQAEEEYELGLVFLRPCLMEVFIDKNDFYSMSIFIK